MERSRRLYQLWNWLVPFRVVAETGGLAEASKKLQIASSALSRSVKLLEQALDEPLFERTPGGLQLNSAGRSFLTAVRTAMRVLDDGVTVARGEQFRGPVFVNAPGDVLPVVVPALVGVQQEHPDLVPELSEVGDVDAIAGLRRGEIDVAVVDQDIEDASLSFRPLTALERTVCVAPGHPAASSGHGDLETLAFAVAPDPSGVARDGFPNHIDRRIAVRARGASAVLEAVRGGSLAAVLPAVSCRAAGLVPLTVAEPMRPARLSLALRPQLSEAGRIEVVAGAVGAALGVDDGGGDARTDAHTDGAAS